jgi:hypothetical protein
MPQPPFFMDSLWARLFLRLLAIHDTVGWWSEGPKLYTSPSQAPSQLATGW